MKFTEKSESQKYILRRVDVLGKASALLILLLLSIMVIPCRASTVWSDNFDNGNLEGWTISGTSYAGRNIQTLEIAKGNCSTIDKTLQETSSSKMSAYTFVSHPNGVNTGTWGFDVYFNEGGTYNGCSLIFNLVDKAEITKADWLDWHGYEIRVGDRGTFGMQRIDHASGNPTLYGNYPGLKVQPGSWYHFDVTRDSSGRFLVYVNGTVCLDMTDNKITSFSYVGFWLQPGPAIDNVVVSDTMHVPPGSLRVSVKDSTGSALKGAVVSSSKQPGGQTALNGVTGVDGAVTFTRLAIGNYTMQVSMSGYSSGSAQGVVASGGKSEVSTILQAQPSSGGVPGFPFMSLVLGMLLCTSFLWLYKHKPRL